MPNTKDAKAFAKLLEEDNYEKPSQKQRGA